MTVIQRLPPAWRKCLTRAPIALALMAAIFVQSAQPGLLGDLGIWSLILTSIGHTVLFGSLAALLWWALRPVTDRALLIAVVAALLYGISDEVHQSFVAARDGSVLDIGFDALGIAIAAFLVGRTSFRDADPDRGQADAAPRLEVEQERTPAGGPPPGPDAAPEKAPPIATGTPP